MKYLAVIAVLSIATALPRIKREALSIPDGADLVVGPLETNFTCEGKAAGFYAEADDCHVFHVCNPATDDIQETQQYSFFCPKRTIYDAATNTCVSRKHGAPRCKSANHS